ncbi:hypothetical protein [Photobacterium lipolyticum]|nr:hypothetical protein [Photobacterium lipolyticum]
MGYTRHCRFGYFTKAKGEFVAEMVLVEKDGRFLVDHAMVF